MLSNLRHAGIVLSAAVLVCASAAQQPLGSVATKDALVTGGLEVQGDRARVLTSATITAYDRTAPIELTRGGQVLVCSTTRFHLLPGASNAGLVFALDRGAMEVHADVQTQDVLMTPDLRFSFGSAGKLDLRLRVTPNGDTCVENAGASAPTLEVTELFSAAMYRLKAQQHVLFEHGSLHEVVDQERSPCGCPPVSAPVQTAQAPANGPSTAEQVAARNPFPSAVSQGLAPEVKPANNTGGPGEVHAQVASTLAYTPGEATSASEAAPMPAAAPASPSSVAGPPPAPPGAHDIAHAIGRFFHRLFHRKA